MTPSRLVIIYLSYGAA